MELLSLDIFSESNNPLIIKYLAFCAFAEQMVNEIRKINTLIFKMPCFIIASGVEIFGFVAYLWQQNQVYIRKTRKR